mgnify:CR=1 FL=1
MNTSDFYYDLPEGLIAQDPLEDRASSRLLVMDRNTGEISHHRFHELAGFLRPGDCLVRNNTKVLPARLYGHKINEDGPGAAVEVLLLKRMEDNCWETLVRPGKRIKEGCILSFGSQEESDMLKAEVLQVMEDGNRILKFSFSGIFEEILDQLGEMPLPPYIKHKLKDKNRYQTVYAKEEGSAAAPTAGLHFTEELFREIEAMGVIVANVTLHVGLGTFRPVSVDHVENHKMHTEYYEISEEEAEKINQARENGGRIICVGTTSCRTLESAADEQGVLKAGQGNTDIFIYPGYSFKIMDGLITNFHLPCSTLLMLVSAFAGKDHILHAYREAVEEEYRFFSFGDAMFLGDLTSK